LDYQWQRVACFSRQTCQRSRESPASLATARLPFAFPHQSLDRGVAAIRPVPDVVRIDETAMAAARKAAAAVTRLQGPAQCRRYGAGLAPDIEWIA